MNVVYSFVGILPPYSILTVRQLRCFFKGPVYFILDDLESPFVPHLKSFGVQIIDYLTVRDMKFLDKVCETRLRNSYIENNPGREWLFVRSFERFFLLHNLMKQKNIEDVLFLELDNLLYDNPECWMNVLAKKQVSFMFDNKTRCSSGVAFFKHSDSLHNVLDSFYDYLDIYDKDHTICLNEMDALYHFYSNNNDVYILPTHWKSENISTRYHEHFGDFGNTIFDSAPYGIFLFGEDYGHNEGKRVKGTKWKGSELDVTHYEYVWSLDNFNRKIPYIKTNDILIRLNNLHIHCKELQEALSID